MIQLLGNQPIVQRFNIDDMVFLDEETRNCGEITIDFYMYVQENSGRQRSSRFFSHTNEDFTLVQLPKNAYNFMGHYEIRYVIYIQKYYASRV